jgi:predicted acylesterase/phospholipase RssA
MACAICSGSGREIGKNGGEINVFALRGGALLDSVFQLGIAHAHIVSNADPPALIVGVSSGGIHGTAIAETLRADRDLDPSTATPELRREARLNRFRELLYAFQDFATSAPAALPDTFETDAGKPLQPNPQAIHFETERDSRQAALRARSGMVALINDLFSQSVTIRNLARGARVYFGLKASADVRFFFQRWGLRITELIRAVRILLSAPLQVFKLVWVLGRAYRGGVARILRDEITKQCERERNPKWPSRVLGWLLWPFEGRHDTGYMAGAIIFTWGRFGRIVGKWIPQIVIVMLALIAGWETLRFALSSPVHLLPFFLTLWAAVCVLIVNPPPAVVHLRQFAWKERILTYYDLRRDLGNNSLVEEFLTRLFDPAYHGSLDMDDVAKRAAQRKLKPAKRERAEPRRTFKRYDPMRVVPLAANLATGEIVMVEPDHEIVPSLLAAVSTVPLMPAIEAQKRPGTFYIDAKNVANEPGLAALEILRTELHPTVTKARLFLVNSTTSREQDAAQRPYVGTIDVARAGVDLARFRDQDLERDLLDAINRMFPTPGASPKALHCLGGQHFVQTEVRAVEPATALHTMGRFLEASTKEERQRVVAQAVAEGCRSTLAALQGEDSPSSTGCRAIRNVPLREGVPGATEVCAHCAFRVAAPAAKPAITFPTGSVAATTDVPQFTPSKALLFSGGVFRGVFQIGVLNAVNQLGLRPDIIAGASVGSIVAAMVAAVFAAPDKERNEKIARLASTFMMLDRLVITDRFADFVRRFTLRAAAARFSLRDADRFFRNYDVDARRFDQTARRVIGGIEHMLYLDPLTLGGLTRAIRRRDFSTTMASLSAALQDFCGRGLVDFEVLGAEPLSLLIKQHVLDEGAREKNTHAVALEWLTKEKFTFLMTATNVTRRRLDVIGLPDPSTGELKKPVLIEALLASSAFPGVFRPRWAREVFFDDNSTEQYIDGGVLDNLPFSAVIDHLALEVKRGRIVPRPLGETPHLIITASLEPQALTSDGKRNENPAESWIAARRAVQRLGYNRKIDRFSEVQDELRAIFEQYRSQGDISGAQELDLFVLPVKPKWLCSTFGFHPMLGFRRKKQAASIAHGCASTFAAVKKLRDDPQRGDYVSAWGMDAEAIYDEARDLKPRTVQKKNGECYFNKAVICPFSLAALKTTSIHGIVQKEIATIYELCGKRETHQRPPT